MSKQARANIQRGMTASTVGRTVEAAVQACVDLWTVQEKAALTPGHPGVRFVAGGKAMPKGKGTVDWTGILHGVAVAFDVKGTSGATFSASNRALPAHEVAFLKAFHRAGGTAFLLVCEQALTTPRWNVWLLCCEANEWRWRTRALQEPHKLPELLRSINRHGELRNSTGAA